MLNINSGVNINNQVDVMSGIMGEVTGNRAVMYIFTPAKKITQVVRPYKYAFTDNVVNNMMDVHSNTNRISNLNLADDDLKKAVIPSSQGIHVDLFNIENYYTYMLIIDTRVGNELFGTSQNTSKRLIYAGYFLDEPFVPSTLHMSTPTMNPNARAIVTHGDCLQNTVAFTEFGRQSPTDVIASNDMVHQHMGQNFNEQVGLCDYIAISKGHGVDNSGHLIRNSNPIVLPEMSKNAESIPLDLRSPRSHINGIANAVANGIDERRDYQVRSQIMEETDDGKNIDMFNNVSSAIVTRLQRPTISSALSRAFDPSMPITMGELDRLLEGGLQVQPFSIPFNPQVDIKDPTSISAENVMGSMAAHTVTAYATNCGLSTVAFRYSSYLKSIDNPSLGVWVWEDAKPTIAVASDNNQAVSQFVRTFEMLMETGLFPLLKAHYGEFDLLCKFNLAGDMLISLKYMDMANNTHNDGFVIVHNALGGMISPSLGSYEDVAHNRNQITELLSRAVGKTAGIFNNQQNFTHMQNQPDYSNPSELDDHYLDHAYNEVYGHDII